MTRTSVALVLLAACDPPRGDDVLHGTAVDSLDPDDPLVGGPYSDTIHAHGCPELLTGDSGSDP